MVLEAPKTRINEVNNFEIDRIANMNKLAYAQINKVRKYINDRLPYIDRIKNNEKLYNKQLKKIEDFILVEYGVMFTDFKSMLVDALNESGVEQRYLAQLALGQDIKWNKAILYKELPKTSPFKVTNRILSQKSILRRNKVLAGRVTKIIDDNVKIGKSIQDTTKKIEIELGFRDRTGRTSRSALKLLKEGRFAHSNGHFYKAYRIARTESIRMGDIAANNVAEELSVKYNDVRLKMISKLDSRTRTQSRQMNNQISTANFTFRYPNGKFYKKGSQPVRWAANDREATVTVFLDDSRDRKRQDFADVNDYKRNELGSLYK